MKWEQFNAVYDRQLRQMAANIVRRWPLPGGVDAEDVFQELRVRAWKALDAYEPDRGGMNQQSYAIFMAKLHAQGWVHEQRNSPRRRGKGQGRFPACAVLVDELSDENVMGEVQIPGSEAGQEVVAEFSEKLRIALDKCAEEDLEVFDALLETGFDVEESTVKLCENTARKARSRIRYAMHLMEQSA